MKGRDLQPDFVAASTAKHKNTRSENTDTTYTARDSKCDIKILNTKDDT